MLKCHFLLLGGVWYFPFLWNVHFHTFKTMVEIRLLFYTLPKSQSRFDTKVCISLFRTCKVWLQQTNNFQTRPKEEKPLKTRKTIIVIPFYKQSHLYWRNTCYLYNPIFLSLGYIELRLISFFGSFLIYVTIYWCQYWISCYWLIAIFRTLKCYTSKISIYSFFNVYIIFDRVWISKESIHLVCLCSKFSPLFVKFWTQVREALQPS